VFDPIRDGNGVEKKRTELRPHSGREWNQDETINSRQTGSSPFGARMGSRGKEQSFDPIRKTHGIKRKQPILDKQARPHTGREWGREVNKQASTREIKTV
jgi:hypothetical protein